MPSSPEDLIVGVSRCSRAQPPLQCLFFFCPEALHRLVGSPPNNLQATATDAGFGNQVSVLSAVKSKILAAFSRVLCLNVHE